MKFEKKFVASCGMGEARVSAFLLSARFVCHVAAARQLSRMIG
jgi:hypothetical protein